jgi:RNA polymerase sigma-70 factor, Bacteroides expansion family 1
LNKSETTSNFENIYLTYFSKIKHFAKVYVISDEDAENIVQDVFMELWEHRNTRFEYTNLVAYLFTTTKNKCLNFLRHKTIIKESADKIQEEYNLTLQASLNSLEALDVDLFSTKDTEEILKNALNALPEKCRQIFIMNKIEGKKQKEIASILNISVNTVETQMGIAYKQLRKELKNYLPLFIFMCL